jgi:hypothetical protein
LHLCLATAHYRAVEVDIPRVIGTIGDQRVHDPSRDHIVVFRLAENYVAGYETLNVIE